LSVVYNKTVIPLQVTKGNGLISSLFAEIPHTSLLVACVPTL